MNPQNRFWQNFKKKKLALFGICFIVLIAFCTIFCSYFTRYEPNNHGNLVTERYLGPSADHFFGTDKFGRDIFSRVFYGGRFSMAIAVSIVFLSITVGLIYGTISGYFG